ncbi:hypothetical protein K7432_004740 [Basidiobolus ranarum]|uniref:Uncharacterized protein n=1 Tax=Basidiobolus ranarum TaxID=34480 RepID=A0ABR2WXN9_9FUNG
MLKTLFGFCFFTYLAIVQGYLFPLGETTVKPFTTQSFYGYLTPFYNFTGIFLNAPKISSNNCDFTSSDIEIPGMSAPLPSDIFGTVLLFPQMEELGCQYFTQILAQFELLDSLLLSSKLPPLRLAIFTSKENHETKISTPFTEFGKLKRLPNEVKLALTTKEQSTLLRNKVTTSKPFLVHVVEEPGIWNELHESLLFLAQFWFFAGMKMATGFYGLIQLGSLFRREGIRADTRVIACLFTCTFLFVASVLPPVRSYPSDFQSIVMISLILGYAGNSLMVLSWKRIITSHLPSEDFKFLGFTMRFELYCLAGSCVLLTGSQLLENEMLLGYIQLFILYGLSTTILITRLMSFRQARSFLKRLGSYRGSVEFTKRLREVTLEGSYAMFGFGTYLLINSVTRVFGTWNLIIYTILIAVSPIFLCVSVIIMFHLLYKEKLDVNTTHIDPTPIRGISAKVVEVLSQQRHGGLESYCKLDEEI